MTLDRVILHTVVHNSLVDLYLHAKISLKSKKPFVDGRTDVRMHVRTYCTYGRTFEAGFKDDMQLFFGC